MNKTLRNSAAAAGVCCCLSLVVIAVGFPRPQDKVVVKTPDGPATTAPLIDMGSILLGEAPRKPISITNHTRRPVYLTGNASCECTGVEFDATTLAPGEKTSARVRYQSYLKPENLGPVLQPFVIVATPDEGEPTLLTGTVKVFVRPTVEILPGEFRFPHDYASGPAYRQVKVTNRFSHPVDVRFQEPAVRHGVSVSPAHATIPQGESLQFEIGVLPADTSQPLKFNLRINVSTDESGEHTTHTVPMLITPSTPLIATPGAVMFGYDRHNRKSTPAEIVVRVADPSGSSDVTWESSSPAVEVERRDDKFLVRLVPDSVDIPFLNETITFKNPGGRSVVVSVVVTPYEF